eukprot:1161526-Pelagomonas_calceolata.AAC.2
MKCSLSIAWMLCSMHWRVVNALRSLQLECKPIVSVVMHNHDCLCDRMTWPPVHSMHMEDWNSFNSASKDSKVSIVDQ